MADQKLTALTLNTAPISTDIAYMVDDPAGSPLSQATTFANVSKALIAANIPNVAVLNIANTFTGNQVINGSLNVSGGTGGSANLVTFSSVVAGSVLSAQDVHLFYYDSDGDSVYDQKDKDGNTDVRIRTGGDSYITGGNVGIGIALPNEKLHVTGGTLITGTLNSINYNGLSFDYNSGTSRIVSGGQSGANTSLSLYTTAGGVEGERVRIDSAGNVGIGTTSPDTKLEVEKSSGWNPITTTSSSIYAQLVSDSAVGLVDINWENSADLRFSTSSTKAGGTYNEVGRLSSSGDLAVTGGITAGAQMYITEQAAADADIAAKGQIWVKNDAPNTLWFTDDAGTDTQLGVGGGGGGASRFEATVGATGADYTTLGAAIAAGKTRILVIDSTTETGNISIPASAIVMGIGKNTAKIDLGATYGITMGNYGILKDIYIESSRNSPVITLANNCVFDNCSFHQVKTSDATGTAPVLYDGGVSSLDNLIVNCDFHLGTAAAVDYNNISGIFLDSSSSRGNIIDNCNFFGNSSTSKRKCIHTDGQNTAITNCYFLSIGDSTGDIIVINASYCTLDNLTFYGSFGKVSLAAGATYANVNALSGNDFQLEFDGADYIACTGCTIRGTTIINGTNINMAGCYFGTLTLQAGATDCRFSSSYLNTLNDDAGNKNIHLSSCYINNAVTLDGDLFYFGNTNCAGNITINSGSDLHSFSGCNIEGTVSVTGNDVTFSGCKVGADVGGGVNTITINAGATNTIIGNTRTDAAISDAGTGSALSNNVVY